MGLFSRGAAPPVADPHRLAFELEALPHLREINAAAYRLARHQGDAEDLAQEVFLRAWKSWHRFQQGTNCRAWLYKILWNVFHQKLRKKVPIPLGNDGEHLLESLESRAAAPAGVTDEEVAKALDRLPEIHRQIVLLSYVEGFTYREIASIVGVPVGTVMSRLFRARGTLRSLLGGASGNPSSAVSPGGEVVQP